jgi:hypothetical protein
VGTDRSIWTVSVFQYLTGLKSSVASKSSKFLCFTRMEELHTKVSYPVLWLKHIFLTIITHTVLLFSVHRLYKISTTAHKNCLIRGHSEWWLHFFEPWTCVILSCNIFTILCSRKEARIICILLYQHKVTWCVLEEHCITLTSVKSCPFEAWQSTASAVLQQGSPHVAPLNISGVRYD